MRRWPAAPKPFSPTRVRSRHSPALQRSRDDRLGTPPPSGGGVPSSDGARPVAPALPDAIMGRMETTTTSRRPRLRIGMAGLGMIFDDTYRPVFEQLRRTGLFRRDFGLVEVELSAVASRTGARAQRLKQRAGDRLADFASFLGSNPVPELIEHGVDAVCVATPDDRHFEAAHLALAVGKHVLIEKPSVLRLQELDELDALARRQGVLAKVVYHKLGDPDHKKLRTHVVDGVLKHVNNGYCSLLEPKSISGEQFAEWITGRNPGTYVACHYIKLIDFSFGGSPGAPAWNLDRKSVV